jgi:hypothetical protein
MEESRRKEEIKSGNSKKNPENPEYPEKTEGSRTSESIRAQTNNLWRHLARIFHALAGISLAPRLQPGARCTFDEKTVLTVCAAEGAVETADATRLRGWRHRAKAAVLMRWALAASEICRLRGRLDLLWQ